MIATEDPASFDDVWFARFFPSVPEIERDALPERREARGRARRRRLRPTSGSSSSASSATTTREHALDVIRSRRSRPSTSSPRGVRRRARAGRGRAARAGSSTASTGCSPSRGGEARGYPREWLVLGLIALGTLPLVERPRRAGLEPPRADRLDRPARRGRHRSLLEADDRPRLRRAATGTPTRRPACRSSLFPRSRRPRGRCAGQAGCIEPSRSGCASGRSGRSRIWGGGIAFLALAFLLGRVAEGLVEGTGRGDGRRRSASGRWPARSARRCSGTCPTRLRSSPRSSSRPAPGGRATGSGSACSRDRGALRVPGRARRRRSSSSTRRSAAAGGPRSRRSPAASRPRSCSAATTGSPSARRGGSRTATPTTSSRQQQQQGLFGVGLPTPHGIWTLLIDGHGLLLVSPVLLASRSRGSCRFWRRARLEAAVGRRDRVLFCRLHDRVLPAERRDARRARASRPRRCRSCCSGCRSRSRAGATSRWRSRALGRRRASSTSSRGRSRTGSSSSAGRRRSGRCSGSSRREGCVILLRWAPRRRSSPARACSRKRFRERPVGVLESAAPEPDLARRPL